MKYVALLRGINVGGKNKVDMKTLVKAMEAAGFSQVSTYINSGNIFFSDERERSKITAELEALIEREFGIIIKVLLRSKPEIEQVTAKIPTDWSNGPDMKCDVMFLWPEYDHRNILGEMPIRPEVDTAIYESGAVIWKIDRENINKSGLTKLVGTDLYAHMTIRNCNTVRKIEQILNSVLSG